jgi:hypothetical protein
MIAETHMAHGEMMIRDIIGRMRHDGCAAAGLSSSSFSRHTRSLQAGSAHRAARMSAEATTSYRAPCVALICRCTGTTRSRSHLRWRIVDLAPGGKHCEPDSQPIERVARLGCCCSRGHAAILARPLHELLGRQG